MSEANTDQGDANAAPPCCPPGSLGEAPASSSKSDKPCQGKMVEIPVPSTATTTSADGKESWAAPMPCYCTGAPLSSSSQPDQIVVIFTDVYGIDSGRHKIFADLVAESLGSNSSTCSVLIPDLFRGTPIMQPWLSSTSTMTEVIGSGLGAPGMVYRLKQHYPPNKLERDIFQLLLPWIESQLTDDDANRKKKSDIKLSCIGFCFGGYVVGRALGYKNNDNTQQLQFQCGVGIHPSFQINVLHGELSTTMAERIHKPMLLLPGKNDLDMKPGTSVANILTKNIQNENNNEEPPVVSIPFPSMWHGWVTRGDRKDPQIAKEQDRALQLAVEFIQKHSN